MDREIKADKKKWVHGEVRRKQIFEEAIHLIGQRGYQGFSLQELAQRCELSIPGLLHHFPSKDQLLIALLQELDRRYDVALEVAGLNYGPVYRARSSTPILLDAVYQILHKVVERDSTHPEIVRFYTVLRTESLNENSPAQLFFRDRSVRSHDALTGLLEPHVPEPLSTARQLIALHAGLEEQWLREDCGFDLVAEWDMSLSALLSPR